MLTAKDTVTIWVNMGITAVANFVCVWLIKLVEEKARKDRLWKFEATFDHTPYTINQLKQWSELNHIPISYIDIDKYYIVNFYAKSQLESTLIKCVIEQHNGKYFVTESKI